MVTTVKPVLSGHPWGIVKCPLNTGPLKINFGCGQTKIIWLGSDQSTELFI